MQVVDDGAWSNYEFVVRTSDGQTVERTRFGEGIGINQIWAASLTIDLSAGVVIATSIPINALFDVTLPGNYVVSASRLVWADGNEAPETLVSNDVEFQVSRAAEASVITEALF
jgi:hypothetical protein